VLTNDWRGPGDSIAINEREQPALCDFCSSVYQAWGRARYRDLEGRRYIVDTGPEKILIRICT
jgi:hypothetical protein